MLTDDDKKLLTELLGEVFHGYTDDVTPDGQWRMSSCYDFIIRENHSNRTFTIWQDTGDLKERIVEMGEWHGFWMYAATEFKEVQHKAGKVVRRKSEMSNWLMNPIRFPELVVGWIKERGRG
jgi:hypothetical protein